jgi:hypothetical protein
MRCYGLLAALVVTTYAIAGCAQISCLLQCGSHAHNSPSPIESLYPDSRAPTPASVTGRWAISR